jgi:hypothetical protein
MPLSSKGSERDLDRLEARRDPVQMESPAVLGRHLPQPLGLFLGKCHPPLRSTINEAGGMREGQALGKLQARPEH